MPAEEALAWLEDPGPEVKMRVHEFRRRWWMPRQLRRAGVDVLHAIDPNLLPIGGPFATVATCHDVIPLVLQPPTMSDKRHAKLRREEKRRFAGVDHILADSENTRRDAMRELGIPAERISVVPLGVDASSFARPDLPLAPPRWKLPERYLVSVGSDYYRKNQKRLVEAWASVAELIPEGLVLVGRPLYDSTFEALEAMAAGTPVMACANGAYEEVAGDAALYFDGESTAGIAERLVRVSEDAACRAELVRLGAERVERFSWRATGEATWRVYEGILWPQHVGPA